MRPQLPPFPDLDRSLSEPCGLGVRLASTVEATRNLWGDAAIEDILCRVSSDARAGYERRENVPRWVPERWFVEWYEALSFAHDVDGLLKFADEVTDCGFGRAKRIVLSLASPWMVCRQGERLWKSEHSHGRLFVKKIDATCARISLSDHPFVDSALAAHGIAEAFRYILSLSNAQGATLEHAIEGGVLHATIRWD